MEITAKKANEIVESVNIQIGMLKILQIANGDFFSTYGGGQVYVKNLVDALINQELDITVLSFVNKSSEIAFQKLDYKGIDLYEIYQKGEEAIKTLIQQIMPTV